MNMKYFQAVGLVWQVFLLSLTDGMEVDASAMEAGQFEDADVEHW